MNGLADRKLSDINQNLLRQILRQRADLEFENDVFENAAASFDADRFAGGFNGHHDGYQFVFGDFMKINVQHFSGQRVMLDFLNEREALLLVHVQIHENVLGEGLIDEIGHFAPDKLEIFGLGLTTVDGGRDATCITEFFYFRASRLGARKCIQWNRFHGKSFFRQTH